MFSKAFKLIALCGFALAIYGSWVGWTVHNASWSAENAYGSQHSEHPATESSEWFPDSVKDEQHERRIFNEVATRRLLLGLFSALYFPILAFALVYLSCLEWDGGMSDLAVGGKVLAVIAPIAMFCGTEGTKEWSFHELLIVVAWVIYLFFASWVLWVAVRQLRIQDASQRHYPVFSVIYGSLAILGLIVLLSYPVYHFVTNSIPFTSKENAWRSLNHAGVTEADVDAYHLDKWQESDQLKRFVRPLVAIGYLLATIGIVKSFSRSGVLPTGPSSLALSRSITSHVKLSDG